MPESVLILFLVSLLFVASIPTYLLNFEFLVYICIHTQNVIVHYYNILYFPYKYIKDNVQLRMQIIIGVKF